MISKTRALHKHKLELEEQKKTLVRERQYADNMGKMKLARDKKIYKTFGLLKQSSNTATTEGEMVKDNNNVVTFDGPRDGGFSVG